MSTTHTPAGADLPQGALTDEDVARAAFRGADEASPMRDKSNWQIWRDAWAAALAARPGATAAAGVPEGWVLVPNEAGMTDKQGEAICAHAPICGGGAYDLYRALLEASPTAPQEHLTITTDEQGRCLAVSWQDDEHRILRLVWEAPDTLAAQTETQPASEAVGEIVREPGAAAFAVNWLRPPGPHGTKLYTTAQPAPAPGAGKEKP